MHRSSVLLLVTTAAMLAQTASLRKSVFEQRPAMVIANDKVQLTLLTEGASFTELVLVDDPDRLNPLWNPDRMARELGQSSNFGFSRGHFVCVDGFGPVSPEERAAGLPGHGEAHRQTMEIRHAGKAGNTATVTMSATLPLVQERFTRTVKLVDGENVVYVESELENLLAFDRPINWSEHATIGSPFLEPGVTMVDLSSTRSRTRPYQGGTSGPVKRRLTSGEDFTWPSAKGRNGETIDLRAGPTELGYMDHITTVLDPAQKLAWVTALHPQRRLIIGYLFRREDYPWLQQWGHYPPTGKLARGLEFGTQPFDVSRREAVSTGTLFETPTYRWLPAKGKLQTRFLMFYSRIPAGFQKVDAVRMENGQILMEDRSAGKQVRLTATLPL